MLQTENLYNEIIALIKTSDNPLYFHFYKHGLFIKSQIAAYEEYDDGIQVQFNSGRITFWKDNKYVKIRRPDNMLIECENCYRIYNEYGDEIGYIYN